MSLHIILNVYLTYIWHIICVIKLSSVSSSLKFMLRFLAEGLTSLDYWPRDRPLIIDRGIDHSKSMYFPRHSCAGSLYSPAFHVSLFIIVWACDIRIRLTSGFTSYVTLDLYAVRSWDQSAAEPSHANNTAACDIV